MTEFDRMIHEAIAMIYVDKKLTSFHGGFFDITEDEIIPTYVDRENGRFDYNEFLNYSFPCSKEFENGTCLRKMLDNILTQIFDEYGGDEMPIDLDSLDMVLLNEYITTYNTIVELR